MSTRLATTVLLLRGGRVGLEVFMVQRHRNMGFLPNAWVFPGGRVDAADRMAGHPALVGGDQVLQQLRLPEENAIAHVVAGLRETWEEIGVWLGEGAPDPALRHAVATRRTPLTDVLGASSRLHLDALRAWSWWVTPEAEPKRYDTRFLVTLAEDADGSHDEHETVDSRWVDPREVLASARHADFPLAPPTWWTLKELAAHDSAEAAFEAAAQRVQRPIQPVMRFGSDGISLLLPGHPEHPEPPIEGLPTGIVFQDGGWVTS
jgi:8-oxo-dGTP pyrophosphatase MutT (NUDIX family)